MRELFTNAKAHAFKTDEERNNYAIEYQKNPSAELRDILIIGNIFTPLALPSLAIIIYAF